MITGFVVSFTINSLVSVAVLLFESVAVNVTVYFPTVFTSISSVITTSTSAS